VSIWVFAWMGLWTEAPMQSVLCVRLCACGGRVRTCAGACVGAWGFQQGCEWVRACAALRFPAAGAL